MAAKNHSTDISASGKPDSTSASTLKISQALRREVHVFREKDKDVKNTTVRILLALALLIGFGVTPVLADGWPAPTCKPPLVCIAR